MKREVFSLVQVLLSEGAFYQDSHQLPILSPCQLDKDSISSSHRNSISLTRFALPLCILLSFLMENFYPHTLKLQKGASFESWAVPGPPLHMRRARLTCQPRPYRGCSGPHTIIEGCLGQSPYSLGGRVEEIYRKTIEQVFCDPWKYPRGLTEKEKEEKDSFIHPDPLNPSTQVANDHCPKGPPPQPIHSPLRFEKAAVLPILKSA